MDNPVVAITADASARSGVATLRFDFRGVGASEGAYSGSFAEAEDALAAVRHLRERAGLARVTLAGYSFGAMIACLAAEKAPGVEAIVAIALPATMFDPRSLERSSLRKLFLLGTEDDYCPEGALRALVARMPGRNEIRTIDGADHFLAGFESEVAAAVVRFVGED